MSQLISLIKSYSKNKEITCCNYAVVMGTLDPDHVMWNKPKSGIIITYVVFVILSHEAVIKIKIWHQILILHVFLPLVHMSYGTYNPKLMCITANRYILPFNNFYDTEWCHTGPEVSNVTEWWAPTLLVRIHGKKLHMTLKMITQCYHM